MAHRSQFHYPGGALTLCILIFNKKVTVTMRVMVPGGNVLFLMFLVVCGEPRCHLTDGCHLTHTVAIMQLNVFLKALQGTSGAISLMGAMLKW